VRIWRVQYQAKPHQVGGGQWRCWESPELKGRGGTVRVGQLPRLAFAFQDRHAAAPKWSPAMGSCYPLRGLRHGVRIADGSDFLLRTSSSALPPRRSRASRS